MTRSDRVRGRLRKLAVRVVAMALVLLAAAAALGGIELGSWGLLRLKGKTVESFGRRYSVDRHVTYAPWVGPRYLPFREEVRTGLGTDRHGFIHNGNRDRDLSTKAPGVYRIFVLGGSPIAGMWEPGGTIAGRLESRLNAVASAGRRYEVVNAAVEGWNSSQELALLEYYLPDFAPDLVIAIDGFNDAFQVFRAPREGFHPNVSGHITALHEAALVHTYSIRGTFAQALGMLRDRSYAYNVWNETRAMVRARVAGPDASPAAAHAGLEPDPMRYYRRNVELMIAASRTLEFAHAAVLMPTMLASNSKGRAYRQTIIDTQDSIWRGHDYWGAKEALYRDAAAAYAQFAARYDDGTRVIVRDYRSVLDAETEPSYIDQSHYTLYAADVIAARLADDLTRTILASPAR